MQIRLSSLILAILMSFAVVAGMITLRPSLTQMYYVQLGALVAGAGLVVTLYNALLMARARRRRAAAEAAEVPPAADCTIAETPAAYAATEAGEMLPTPPPALHADDALPFAAAPVEWSATAVISDEDLLEASLPERLDDLLDAAYEAAEHSPARAIAAYRRALARYPDDSYMPYLIIELSTIYKRLGDYDAALRLFDEALALPIIAKNDVVAQEFQRSRRALTVVSHMLTAQGTPTLPFGDVPKEILAEADRRAEELKESLIKQTLRLA